jgi:hypothetical protein
MEEKRLRGETSGNPFAGGLAGNLGGPLAILVLLAVGIGPWFLPIDPEGAWLGPYITGACVLSAAYIAFRLALKIRGRLVWLEVDSAGLRWLQRGNESSRKWDEVSNVRRSERLARGVQHGSVRVEFRDDEVIEFDRMLSNYDVIAMAIQRYAATILRATKEAELAAGGADFGPITLHREGVEYKGREFEWRKVEYGIVRGNLFFVPAGEGFDPDKVLAHLLLEEIPNYMLLLELMERHGKPAISP